MLGSLLSSWEKTAAEGSLTIEPRRVVRRLTVRGEATRWMLAAHLRVATAANRAKAMTCSMAERTISFQTLGKGMGGVLLLLRDM